MTFCCVELSCIAVPPLFPGTDMSFARASDFFSAERGQKFPGPNRRSLGRPILAKPGVEPYDWYRGELTETFTAKIHVPGSLAGIRNGCFGLICASERTFASTGSSCSA